MTAAGDHSRVSELIPWFVNGTLGDAETALVERHVGACLPCRIALNEERRLQRLVRTESMVPISTDSGFDALLQRIDTGKAAQRRPARPARRRFTLPPLDLGLAAAAAFAVAAVTAWVALDIYRNPPADAPFTTLNEPGPSRPARIDVIFVDGIGERDMRAVVRGVGATIVSGPTEIGRYTIELEDEAAAGDPIDAVIARLRADDRIRFAAPSFIAEDGAP